MKQIKRQGKLIVGFSAAVVVSLVVLSEAEAQKTVNEEVEILADDNWQTGPKELRVGANAEGVINLKGGRHRQRSATPENGIKLGLSGEGIYNVYSGTFDAGRNLYIGHSGNDENSGHGEVNVYGGTVDLSHSRVFLDNQGNGHTSGVFYVHGSGPERISGTRRWTQKRHGTVKFGIDAEGVTPIEVVSGQGDPHGRHNVIFEDGATLDVSFLDGSERIGTWDVMTWEGELTNHGLKFADSVDKNVWNFEFVDTEGDGSPDTLRVSAVPDRYKRIASVRKLTGKVSGKAVQSLIQVLNADKLEDRLAAVETLKQMGKAAAPALSAPEAKPAVEVMLNQYFLQEKAIEARLAAGVVDLEALVLNHQNVRLRAIAARHITEEELLYRIASDLDEKMTVREAAGAQLPDTYWRFPEQTQQAYPLPEGSDVLDRIVFGSQPSEAAHNLAPETSRLLEGTPGELARQAMLNASEADVSPDWTVGAFSFTMACDPHHPTHLTMKVSQSPEINPRGSFLAVFHGDEQIAYLNGRDGWSSGGGNLFHGRATTGDWLYVTMVLPESLTAGKQTVHLRVAAYHPHSAPGAFKSGNPSIPVYRAYTHTDALFPLPADEEDTLNSDHYSAERPDSSVDIETAMATLKNTVEKTVRKGQRKSTVSPKAAEYLARATKRDWIESLNYDAVYKTVRNTIDKYVRRHKEGKELFPNMHGWGEHGNLAKAFVILSDMFIERGDLRKRIPHYPEGTPRGKAYADFFVDGYKWRENDRRTITNQVQIVSVGLSEQRLARSHGGMASFHASTCCPGGAERTQRDDQAMGGTDA